MNTLCIDILFHVYGISSSSKKNDFQEYKLPIYVNTTLIEKGNNITYVVNLIYKFTTTSQVV